MGSSVTSIITQLLILLKCTEFVGSQNWIPFEGFGTADYDDGYYNYGNPRVIHRSYYGYKTYQPHGYGSQGNGRYGQDQGSYGHRNTGNYGHKDGGYGPDRYAKDDYGYKDTRHGYDKHGDNYNQGYSKDGHAHENSGYHDKGDNHKGNSDGGSGYGHGSHDYGQTEYHSKELYGHCYNDFDCPMSQCCLMDRGAKRCVDLNTNTGACSRRRNCRYQQDCPSNQCCFPRDPNSTQQHAYSGYGNRGYGYGTKGHNLVDGICQPSGMRGQACTILLKGGIANGCPCVTGLTCNIPSGSNMGTCQ